MARTGLGNLAILASNLRHKCKIPFWHTKPFLTHNKPSDLRVLPLAAPADVQRFTLHVLTHKVCVALVKFRHKLVKFRINIGTKQ